MKRAGAVVLGMLLVMPMLFKMTRPPSTPEEAPKAARVWHLPEATRTA